MTTAPTIAAPAPRPERLGVAAATPAELAEAGASIHDRTARLCRYRTGVVTDDNERLFAELRAELPLELLRYPSGSIFNGWVVPESWRVERALVRRDGEVIFDGARHPLGVAMLSRSFQGSLDLEALRRHVVSNPELPGAHMFHSAWQYRPWDADWALCVPHDQVARWTPGDYEVDLSTTSRPGEMIVAELVHRGRSDVEVVLNAHTCHPGQANDDMAGVAVLVELFLWLAGCDTHYTYRLVLGPEHLGTVFSLSGRSRAELERMACGAFAEMPGTSGPIKVASSFLGDQPIDRALRVAARDSGAVHVVVPWRRGAGNDETVWEAPGWEVPFVEVSRAESFERPFREYHSSLDAPDLMDRGRLAEFYGVFRDAVVILETNMTMRRRFRGLVCLSNPVYDLYWERPDPTIDKALPDDSERWGQLLDSLLRYFDGSTSVLDIALKHELPYGRLHRYLCRFREKGLVDTRFAAMPRRRLAASPLEPDA